MRPGRSGASVPHVASGLAAPVASQDGAGNFLWTWSTTNPTDWRIENSPDGSTGWTEDVIRPGTDRTWPVDSGSTWYRIIGVDALDAPVTGISNVVHVLGA